MQETDTRPAPAATTDRPTILVPIRYPLTDQSSQTLLAAKQVVQEHAPADLLVLHVNLYQTGRDASLAEITRAISPILDGTEASVITRRGFLVEEVILEEANRFGADTIVLGESRKATWRRLLSRLAGNEPAVASFLRENVTAGVGVVEVDQLTEVDFADSGGVETAAGDSTGA